MTWNGGNVSDSGHQYRDAGNDGFPSFAPKTCLSGHDNIADIGLKLCKLSSPRNLSPNESDG